MKKSTFTLPPLAQTLKSLFKLPSRKSSTPIFNRPIGNACPHHRMARILYSTSLTLLVLIAIPVITLKVMTYNFIEDNRDRGFLYETTSDDGAVVMAALPRILHQLPAKLALVATVISVAVGVAHAGFVCGDWGSGKRTQTWAFRRNIMFLHITNSLLILFAFVAIFVTHNSSSRFRDAYVLFRTSLSSSSNDSDSSFRYNIGTFDLETWACDLRSARGADMVRDDYAQQCSIEVAGRALMVPLAAVAWCVAGIAVWGLVGGGRRGPDGERVKSRDVGLDMERLDEGAW